MELGELTFLKIANGVPLQLAAEEYRTIDIKGERFNIKLKGYLTPVRISPFLLSPVKIPIQMITEMTP